MKVKNKCPCGDSCSYNEVVYNTDYGHKSFKEFYENNDNIKPSGLIFFTSYNYNFQQENTGEHILLTYIDDIIFMKKTFFLDTKVIILFGLNPGSNHLNSPPVFNGITTLENFEEYLSNLSKLDIKRSNDKCNINKPCSDQFIQ